MKRGWASSERSRAPWLGAHANGGEDWRETTCLRGFEQIVVVGKKN